MAALCASAAEGGRSEMQRVLAQVSHAVAKLKRKNANVSIPAPADSATAAWTWPMLATLPFAAWGPQKLGFVGCVLIDASRTLGTAELPPYVKEAVLAGFELGVSKGPMADEPMCGVAYVITGVTFDPSASESFNDPAASITAAGVASGQIISATASGCRAAFTAHTTAQRLVEPLFDCAVYSAGQTQGRIYSVLSRRRAQVVDEVLQEGSDMFHIDALLPIAESFGLQDELRIETSGAATAQLRMSGWQVLDIDPFYKPTTKAELEEQGTNVDRPNLAMNLIDNVRKRKGLYRRNLVENAEKQKFSIRGG
jgi:translation elongation factor EF-G